MKKFLLVIFISIEAYAGEPPQGPPALPVRIDSRPRSEAAHLIDLASKERSSYTNLPKSPTLLAALQATNNAEKPLKMVTVSVNVWHNDPCDEELWDEILAEYYKLKNTKFSPSVLFTGINAFIKLTEEKKGQALWGGLSFTEVVDSQKVDQQKTNP